MEHGGATGIAKGPVTWSQTVSAPGAKGRLVASVRNLHVVCDS